MIKKDDLLKALEIVKPGLAGKEIIEQATSFAFINNHVVTYNDEISIRHPVENMDIIGAVRAAELYGFLKKTKANEIKLKTTDNEIRLLAGKAKVGLLLQQEIKLPLEEINIKNIKWHKIPEKLIEGMKFCMFSCSNDMSKPVLTCIYVNKKGFINSSDNFRITQFNLDEELPIDSFLIPAKIVKEIVKYEPIKMASDDSWIHFKTEEKTILSCRIYNDNFPTISRFLKIEGIKIKLPEKLNEILDRASIFSKKEYTLEETIKLTIEEKKMKIEAKEDYGWFEELTNINYKGDKISIIINPHMLYDILKEIKICIISKDKVKFSGDNWDHIVMLVNE